MLIKSLRALRAQPRITVVLAALAALLVAGASLHYVFGGTSTLRNPAIESQQAPQADFPTADRTAPQFAAAPRGVESAQQANATRVAVEAGRSIRPINAALGTSEGAPVAAMNARSGSSSNWPPPIELATSPLQRGAITRSQDPPFGLRVLRGGFDLNQQLAQERAYYLDHPKEYDRFVELFGDVHELR